MEASPFLDPRFLLPAIGTLIGLVAWFVRLEAKTNTTAARLTELERYHAELEKAFDDHRVNPNVHFDIRVAEQVDKRQDQRFNTLENQISDVRVDLKEIKQILSRMPK